jgi:hypothetical protein
LSWCRNSFLLAPLGQTLPCHVFEQESNSHGLHILPTSQRFGLLAQILGRKATTGNLFGQLPVFGIVPSSRIISTANFS